MSAIPIPKPRAVAQEKRPIPLPRSKVPKQNVSEPEETQEEIQEIKPDPQPQQTTLSRRISNTSKQIVEEISSKLDQTRISLKKKHRKSIEEQPEVVERKIEPSPEFFNTIRFKSPLTVTDVASETSSLNEENEFYQRLNSLTESNNDEIDSLPPPKHPPPPLPDMSVYDTPQKSIDSSHPRLPSIIPRKLEIENKIPPRRNQPPTLPYIPPPPEEEEVLPPYQQIEKPIVPKISKTPPISPRYAPPIPDKPPPTPTRNQSSVILPAIAPIEERTTYEAVFPCYPVFPKNEVDSESSGNDSVGGTMDRNATKRSDSWIIYDPVTLDDSTYMNVATYRKNRSSDSESSVNSELTQQYENFVLELHKKYSNVMSQNEPDAPPRPERPSKSTIIEFDPLFNPPGAPADNIQQNPGTNILDEMFQKDLYGTSTIIQPNYDQLSISEESEAGEEFLNPPTPPLRSDSLMEEVPQSDSSKKTVWYSEENTETKRTSTNFFSKLNDVLKRVPESARNIKAGLQKEKFLDRPSLNSRAMYQHRGILFRISSKSVEDLFGEFHFRWLVLTNGVLTFYADNNCENSKEIIPLETIISVQFAGDKKYKLETALFCFELNTTTNRSRNGYVYGIATIQECKHWMQRIAEAMTNRFPVNAIMDYNRMGWTYLKEGITGTWAGAWIVLSRRHLFYAKDGVPMGTIDLRKARCIQLQEPDSDSPRTSDSKGPNLIIDCPEGTIYLRMWTARETKLWCYVTQQFAYKNGRKLDEQQLTKDDVPVIVEKCLNFIYVNGSMSEGIYRRSGSSTAVANLLKEFQRNAWAVTITPEKYSEHDIANVLKRFFRELPEPLLTQEKSHYLCQIANSTSDNSERVTLYQAILEQFPKVVYNTLKKLLGHLHFIQEQVNKNKMSAINLASIWGPTLVHHDGSELEMSATLCKLLVQLIELYRNLFPISVEELNKEKMMLQVLERNFNRQGPQHVRASGDLRVWVHLWDKNGETVIITIGPQRLAAEICIELSSKMNCPAFELQLEELVLNDNLRRPIHYSEKVLEVVLRWGYWDEADRKDNCLVLTSMKKYKQFDKPDTSLIVSEELKYADTKTKQFKNFIFKFEQAKLCYYKESRSMSQKVQEWNIEDIIWYFGCEPKHSPQTKWSITFIMKKQPPKRSKVSPFFGNTIGGNDLATRTKWICTMIRAEHTSGLSPPLMIGNS